MIPIAMVLVCTLPGSGMWHPLKGLAVGFLVGLAWELLQKHSVFIPGRFDWDDVWATVVGGILGGMIPGIFPGVDAAIRYSNNIAEMFGM